MHGYFVPSACRYIVTRMLLDNVAQVLHMLLLEVCRTKPGVYTICEFGDFMSTPYKQISFLNTLNTTWTLILNLTHHRPTCIIGVLSHSSILFL